MYKNHCYPNKKFPITIILAIGYGTQILYFNKYLSNDYSILSKYNDGYYIAIKNKILNLLFSFF